MDNRELNRITANILDLIEECEDGDCATIAELVREIGIDSYKLDFGDMFDIQSSVFDAASGRGIFLDMAEHEGKEEGLPFHLDFVIYKENSVKSIRINSTNICYGPRPDDNEEVEQTLTIYSTGKVTFTARNYKQHCERKGTCRTKSMSIGKWKTDFLIKMILNIQDADRFATDIGSYTIRIAFADGRKKTIEGSMYGDVFSCVYGGDYEVDLTRLVRRFIPVRKLWVFDGSTSPDYEGKKALHLFAKKWEEFFMDTSLGYDFEDGFGKECNMLGFQMDCGNEFIRVCGNDEAISLYSLLEEGDSNMLQKIDDIEIIGSALYSYWRGLTHWCYMYTLGEKECNAFLGLLRRLKELTKRKQQL